MRKRIHHKMAKFQDEEGFWPLCKYIKNSKVKSPILEMRWKDVTCKHCWIASRCQVPDGMSLKLVK